MNKENNVLWITLEGPHRVGKSTQIVKLQDYLESKWYEVLVVKEPWSTELGDDIRYLAQTKEYNPELHILSNQLLYCAARQEVYSKILHPFINKGKWKRAIIADRSFLSGIAYTHDEKVQQSLAWIQSNLIQPTLEDSETILNKITIILNTSLEVIQKRNLDKWDKWEFQGDQFLERVISEYEQIGRSRDRRYQLFKKQSPSFIWRLKYIFTWTKSPERVFKEISKYLENKDLV